MRDTISKFLSEKVTLDPDVFVFTGDHGYALFDELRRVKPKQFINAGVSEQAMVGYAAGMAKEGMKPFVYGLSAFIPIRVLEFIKMDVCYEKLPVIFLGDGAGLVYATLGASHQCAEDIACLRTLPNINIYSPADSIEMRATLDAAFKSDIASYIRIGKDDKNKIHSSALNLDGSNFIPVVRKEANTCIIATGSMVKTSLDISKIYDVDVFSAPVLSFLKSREIISLLENYKCIITMEEHSINGGLGSIIAEILAETGNIANKRLVRIGIDNHFTQKCGSYEYAMKEHGLDYDAILTRLKSEGILV